MAQCKTIGHFLSFLKGALLFDFYNLIHTWFEYLYLTTKVIRYTLIKKWPCDCGGKMGMDHIVRLSCKNP